MEFKRFNDKYVIRLDKNEEVVETLKNFCQEQEITLGWVNGIGAVNRATIGLFETAIKKYHARELTGDMEVSSLTGNISSMNGEVYLHLHICLSDKENKTYGGHLTSATISATGELIVGVIDGTVDRKFNPEIGLNLLQFTS
ncbi:MAG: PPC domain-containing DNA-binding protein [Bacillota bacterium]|jgi:predicted DNA-binding protein with PD1-like motif